MATILNIIIAVYELGRWLIRVIMLLVIIRKRRPQSATVWLLVVFIAPWLGLLLYALLGSNRLPRKRLEQHRRFTKRLEALSDRFDGHPQISKPRLEPAFAPTVRLTERLGRMAVLGGNAAEIIADNDDLFQRMIDDIDAAKHHVHALYYIYQDDAVGRRFGDALMRAARRGVACRLLVDSVGSWTMLKRLAPKLARAGVEVFDALPVGLFRKNVARYDLRNHRKLLVVDGRIAYMGSHNMVDASYGTASLQWCDLSVRLRGPVVLDLQTVFASDWYFETDDLLEGPEIFPETGAQGDTAIQVIPSGPNFLTENYHCLVVAALHGAQECVTMTTPYFVPDDSMLNALETAALRGVEVNLVVPRESDQIIVGAAGEAHFEELLNWGVNVYLYESAIIHAKTLTLDRAMAFVGTSNLDIRSFALNFECNLAVYSDRFVEQLRRQQQQYIQSSTRLDLDTWEKRSTAHDIYVNLAKLFSPLL